MPNIYVITGCLKSGKRFKPIITNVPWRYNIWKGSLWEIVNGKRKLIRRYNG